MVTKLKCPEAQAIVGIATETGMQAPRSEDALYMDVSSWSEDMDASARELQRELGLLLELKEFRSVEKEYPDSPEPTHKPNRKARRAAAARSRKATRKLASLNRAN